MKTLTVVFRAFDRTDVLEQFIWFSKTNRGAEIGVWNGDFSIRLLESLPKLEMLYLVDSYKQFSKEEYNDVANSSQEIQEARYNLVKVLIGYHPKKVQLFRMLSMEAVKLIEPESLDFVYIDANHSYKCVLEDLTEWGKRVRKGGLIAGHDYGEVHIDVARAVHQYCGDNEISFVKVSKFSTDYLIQKNN